jgi:hypothetical protein
MNKKTKGVISVIAVLALSLSFVAAYDSNEAVAETGVSQTITITSISYEANDSGWVFHITVGGDFESPSTATIVAAGQSTTVSLTLGGTCNVGKTTGGPLAGGSYTIHVQISSTVYADASYVVLGSISLTDATADVGYNTTIARMFDPVNPSNTGLTWSSSDEDIATVSSSGVVKGISEGTVTIRAVSKENATIYDTCVVTVHNYTVVTEVGTGGSISPSGTIHVQTGGSKTFTITASSGYAISDVKVDGVSVGVVSTYTFTDVDDSHTISATFDAVVQYTLTATAGTGGSISPTSATVNPGGSKTFTITASSGYAISDVKVDGVSAGTVSTYTFTDVTASHTISATFTTAVQYTITATAGTGGSISPSGSVTVDSGGSKTFTVSVDSGYNVDKVLVDGEEVSLTNGNYTFTDVTSNHTISVSFVKDSISIWVYVAIAVVIIAVIGIAVYFFVVRNH